MTSLDEIIESSYSLSLSSSSCVSSTLRFATPAANMTFSRFADFFLSWNGFVLELKPEPEFYLAIYLLEPEVANLSAKFLF